MRPKIYLFGDSITEESFSNGGWGASLANHFSRTVCTPPVRLYVSNTYHYIIDILFLIYNWFLWVLIKFWFFSHDFILGVMDFDQILILLVDFFFVSGWYCRKRIQWVQHQMGCESIRQGVSSDGWSSTNGSDSVFWRKWCLSWWPLCSLSTCAFRWIQA